MDLKRDEKIKKIESLENEITNQENIIEELREANFWYKNAFLEFSKLLKYPKDSITKIYNKVKELILENGNYRNMKDEIDLFYKETEALKKSEEYQNINSNQIDTRLNELVYGSNVIKQEKSFEELEKEALREQNIDDEFDSLHRQ